MLRAVQSPDFEVHRRHKANNWYVGSEMFHFFNLPMICCFFSFPYSTTYTYHTRLYMAEKYCLHGMIKNIVWAILSHLLIKYWCESRLYVWFPIVAPTKIKIESPLLRITSAKAKLYQKHESYYVCYNISRNRNLNDNLSLLIKLSKPLYKIKFG